MADRDDKATAYLRFVIDLLPVIEACIQFCVIIERQLPHPAWALSSRALASDILATSGDPASVDVFSRSRLHVVFKDLLTLASALATVFDVSLTTVHVKAQRKACWASKALSAASKRAAGGEAVSGRLRKRVRKE